MQTPQTPFDLDQVNDQLAEDLVTVVQNYVTEDNIESVIVTCTAVLTQFTDHFTQKMSLTVKDGSVVMSLVKLGDSELKEVH